MMTELWRLGLENCRVWAEQAAVLSCVRLRDNGDYIGSSTWLWRATHDQGGFTIGMSKWDLERPEHLAIFKNKWSQFIKVINS